MSTTDSASDKGTGWVVGVLIVLIMIGVVLNAAWGTPEGKAFLIHWWPVIYRGIASLVVIGLIILVGLWFKRTGPEGRTALIVFLFLPTILIAIGATAVLNPASQIVALRCVFLVIVCLLPALIYYLFIATRKTSLLNDYFINLNRLGLLEPRRTFDRDVLEDPGDQTECRVRLLNYLQKFEAIYGAVPAELEERLLSEKNPLIVLGDAATQKSSTSGIVQIFTPEAAIPVIVASVLIALGWLMALPPFGTDPVASYGPDALQKHGFWSLFFRINEDPISYAFLGAYFFSLQMLFRRFVREDLRKSAYVAVSMRIILAVIGTWAVVTGVKTMGRVPPDSLGLALLGFAIGVFPRVAWQFIQGITKAFIRVIGLVAALPSLASRLPVSDLDGLTVWHESRLEEQDIENIPNMATADIVDLIIGTRFPPDRIIDWVDQAILFTHLGPEQRSKSDGALSRRDALRLHGIRTATSLLQAFSHAQERHDDEVTRLLSAATCGHVPVLIDAIQTESNLELICNWRGIRRTKADS